MIMEKMRVIRWKITSFKERKIEVHFGRLNRNTAAWDFRRYKNFSFERIATVIMNLINSKYPVKDLGSWNKDKSGWNEITIFDGNCGERWILGRDDVDNERLRII